MTPSAKHVAKYAIVVSGMKLYIFRHGQTNETKNGIPYTLGRIETAEILEEGIPAIEKLAEHLKDVKTDANYVSPYLRCMQTAEIVSDISGKSFQINELLSEYREDIESFDKFSVRVKNFLDRLAEQAIESAAICTHGGIMAGIKHWIEEDKFEFESLPDFPNPGVLMIYDGKKFSEKDFNN